MSDRPFDVILFDLGNTLLYFDGERSEVFEEASMELLRSLQLSGFELEEHKFPSEFLVQLEDYYVERETAFIEYTTMYVLEKVLAFKGYLDVQEADLRDALAAMYAVTQRYWHKEEDADLTLKKLRDMGYRLGLISNAGDDIDVQALVDKAALRGYFDLIITSAALGIRKPNPRIFQTALNYFEIDPSRTAMVGDKLLADILGAQESGLFSIWIKRRVDPNDEEMEEPPVVPDAEIENLSELVDLLESLVGEEKK